MVMETSEEEPLSIESFSYSWLSNSNLRRPSFDDPPPKPSLGNSPLITSFEDPYPLEKPHNNFDFHTAVSHSQAPFVHADEVFSNGIIRPFFLDNPNHRAGALQTTKAVPVKPSNSVAQSRRGATFPHVHVRCRLPWKWRKSSEKILRKCFSYIKFPSCYNVEGCRRKTTGSGSRADVSADWRFREICSWNSSPPRTSHSVGHWSNNETSINEAILYCKRSISNQEDYYLYET